MNFSNFTAPTFLFYFLPVVLAVYFVTPRPLRNLVLLIASLLFYAEGERFYTLVIVASITFNYVAVLALGAAVVPNLRKLLLVLVVVFNLALLATFKYANFIVDNANVLLAAVHVHPLFLRPVHLPIGISFFTFHALSYVTDVYRREVK